jgi:hypothetical protein
VVFDTEPHESSSRNTKLPQLSKSIETPKYVAITIARGFTGTNKNKNFIKNEKLNLLMSMDVRIPNY